MKKIPVLVTDENIKYANDNNLSFSKIINHLLDKIKNDNETTLDQFRSNPIRKQNENSKLQKTNY